VRSFRYAALRHPDRIVRQPDLMPHAALPRGNYRLGNHGLNDPEINASKPGTEKVSPLVFEFLFPLQIAN
jgi:hypothetical protein